MLEHRYAAPVISTLGTPLTQREGTIWAGDGSSFLWQCWVHGGRARAAGTDHGPVERHRGERRAMTGGI